jgi:hypothetical protein
MQCLFFCQCTVLTDTKQETLKMVKEELRGKKKGEAKTD